MTAAPGPQQPDEVRWAKYFTRVHASNRHAGYGEPVEVIAQTRQAAVVRAIELGWSGHPRDARVKIDRVEDIDPRTPTQPAYPEPGWLLPSAQPDERSRQATPTERRMAQRFLAACGHLPDEADGQYGAPGPSR